MGIDMKANIVANMETNMEANMAAMPSEVPILPYEIIAHIMAFVPPLSSTWSSLARVSHDFLELTDCVRNKQTVLIHDIAKAGKAAIDFYSKAGISVICYAECATLLPIDYFRELMQYCTGGRNIFDYLISKMPEHALAAWVGRDPLRVCPLSESPLSENSLGENSLGEDWRSSIDHAAHMCDGNVTLQAETPTDEPYAANVQYSSADLTNDDIIKYHDEACKLCPNFDITMIFDGSLCECTHISYATAVNNINRWINYKEKYRPTLEFIRIVSIHEDWSKFGYITIIAKGDNEVTFLRGISISAKQEYRCGIFNCISRQNTDNFIAMLFRAIIIDAVTAIDSDVIDENMLILSSYFINLLVNWSIVLASIDHLDVIAAFTALDYSGDLAQYAAAIRRYDSSGDKELALCQADRQKIITLQSLFPRYMPELDNDWASNRRLVMSVHSANRGDSYEGDWNARQSMFIAMNIGPTDAIMQRVCTIMSEQRWLPKFAGWP